MTSGKGGVGKAFVTTNPAVPLARQGHGRASARREASAVGVLPENQLQVASVEC